MPYRRLKYVQLKIKDRADKIRENDCIYAGVKTDLLVTRSMYQRFDGDVGNISL